MADVIKCPNCNKVCEPDHIDKEVLYICLKDGCNTEFIVSYQASYKIIEVTETDDKQD